MPSHVRHFFEKLTGRPRHLADVANDTLSNSNLLHRIVSFIDDEQKRRATLHSLALSNKSLSEAALAELWSDLDGLEMFKGVYDVAERAFYEEHIFQMRSLTIAPLVCRRPEFKRYANLVKRIRWHESRIGLFSALLPLIVRTAPAPLFPNLEAIHWNDFKDGSLGVIESLVMPTPTKLKKLELGCEVVSFVSRIHELKNPLFVGLMSHLPNYRESCDRLAAVLNHVRVNCPLLESAGVDTSVYTNKMFRFQVPCDWALELDLDLEPVVTQYLGGSEYSVLQEVLNSVAYCYWPQLRHCQMASAVPSDCMKFLASAPNLESVELAVVKEQPPIQWTSSSPMFPALKFLSLVIPGGRIKDEREVLDFIQSLRLSKLEKLTVRIVEGSPSALILAHIIRAVIAICPNTLTSFMFKGPRDSTNPLTGDRVSLKTHDNNGDHLWATMLPNLSVLHIIHSCLDIDNSFLDLVGRTCPNIQDLRLFRSVVREPRQRLASPCKTTLEGMFRLTAACKKLEILWLDIEYASAGDIPPRPHRALGATLEPSSIPRLRHWVVSQFRPDEAHCRGNTEEGQRCGKLFVDTLLASYTKLEKLEVCVCPSGAYISTDRKLEDFHYEQLRYWEFLDRHLQKRRNRRSWLHLHL